MNDYNEYNKGNQRKCQHYVLSNLGISRMNTWVPMLAVICYIYTATLKHEGFAHTVFNVVDVDAASK